MRCLRDTQIVFTNAGITQVSSYVLNVFCNHTTLLDLFLNKGHQYRELNPEIVENHVSANFSYKDIQRGNYLFMPISCIEY